MPAKLHSVHLLPFLCISLSFGALHHSKYIRNCNITLLFYGYILILQLDGIRAGNSLRQWNTVKANKQFSKESERIIINSEMTKKQTQFARVEKFYFENKLASSSISLLWGEVMPLEITNFMNWLVVLFAYLTG
jgi:hypothetical protein